MGDRLGTLGAVGILLSIFFFLQVPLLTFFSKKNETGPEYINIRVHNYFFHFHIIR